MARIAFALAALVAVVGITAAVLAHGSEAAPRKAPMQRPAPGPEPGSAAAALPEAPTTIQRTFVSTGGTDANPCTRAEPCRNFAAAIAHATAGGEVIALDSGGYGPFTVPKSLTIAGAPGVHAAVTAFEKTGIEVAVPAALDTVVLRNLYVTGLGGDTGIRFSGGGRLFVESTTATGFTLYGLFADAVGASLFVRDSTFRNNALVGVAVDGALRVEISRSRADFNPTGFSMNGAQVSIVGSEATQNVSAGYIFFGGASATVAGSTAAGNGQGVAAHEDGTSVTVSGAVLTNNNVGLLLGLASPTARIGGSTVSGNVIGLFNNGSGVLETFGDNIVRDNSLGDTDGTITPVSKM